MTEISQRSGRRLGLSKSKMATFEHCPKRLWLQVHRPEEAVIDDATRAVFASGHEVGELACTLCHGGIMVEADPDISAALHRTAELLASDHPLPMFEATFMHEDVVVRVDIMEPDLEGRWRVVEVKSTSSVKKYQLSDLATQIWVMRGCEVPIASAAIRHIDRNFLLLKAGDYRGLFNDVEVSDLIEPIVESRSEAVAAARETLRKPEPQRDVGEHCNKPFSCEFQLYCHQGREEPRWPLAILPHTGLEVSRKWADAGVLDLTDLPPGALSRPMHERIHEATISGEPFHDPEGARAATLDWSYPCTWLDFETIAFAIPRWVGTRPREQVPFQFSAHVEQLDGSVEHRDFLSLDGLDPRLACARALLALVPEQGAVIAYNAAFERSCIWRLAAAFPALSERLLSITARLVDLLPVARRNWYHRDQRGSWSLKSILPTVCSTDYADLTVGDGYAAQRAYLEAINPSTARERHNELAEALRSYCARDTEAMMILHRRLVQEFYRARSDAVQSNGIKSA